MTRIILPLLLSILTLSNVFGDPQDIERLEKKLGNSTDTARVSILNDLSGLYASSDLDHADSLANAALLLLQSLDFPEGQVINFNRLAYISSSLGKNELGLTYSEKAVQLSEELNNQQLLAESYDNLFMIHFRKGDNAEAKIAADKMYEVANGLSSIRLIAKAYDDLGILEGIKGQHTEAIEYFMKSLQHYEELEDDAKISIAMMHLGHTFELAGSYNEALDYLKKSMEINQKTGNKYNEGWALVNIGVVLSRLNQLDTALIYYKRALIIAEEINNHRLILTCLDNIGGKYSMKQDFEQANYYLQRAYTLSQASGANSRTVYITGNLAENYLYMGQFDSARIYGEQQLALALSSEIISEQKVAYYNLAQIYDSLGDFKRAHNALQEYIAVNDTIFSHQKSEQIEALRESFEAEKKEQEISALTTLNEIAGFKNRTYAAAAISFLVLGSLLFYVQRMRVRRNRFLLEKVRELDRVKSRFFANISHEFRTPLTLILGPLADLSDSIRDPSVKKRIGVMQRNTNRLLDLVNQLLELSKIESGSLTLDIAKADIIGIIKGVSMSFDSIAEQKNIDLTLNIVPECLEINFDRAKFETILTNLLANAFKFTPENGRINIQSQLVAGGEKGGNREYLRITVTDSGSGIPAREIDQIFNRFYQSDNSQLLQQEGSGIGLALTKELVELHEGKISAASKEGDGTRIIVEIPTNLKATQTILSTEKNVKEEALLVNNEEIAVIETSDDNIEAEGTLILLIEDHEEVRQYIHEILHPKYQIISANDGEEGVVKALELIPDLIICDVMMPKKDGFEVCRILKNDEKTSHIPIVLLTAKSSSEDKIEGLLTKADDYVTKPFVPKELIVRITNLIDSRNHLRNKYKNEGTLRPNDIASNSIDEKFLNRLIEIVELHMGNEKFSVEQLGIEMGMSRSQLHRKLNALIDQGPNQFIRTFRLQRAHDLLKQNTATAAEIAYEVGFSSPSYFTKCFHEMFGYTPSEIHGQPLDPAAK